MPSTTATTPLEEKVRQAKRLAPYNLAAHAWLLHRNEQEERIVYAAVHQYIAAHLQDVVNYRGLLFVIPPGTGKSTVMQQYVGWRQGATGGRRRIGLISNTASQAEGFSRAIQQSIESEEYREVYPDTARDPRRRWTSREMYFTNTPQGANPGILALGMDGPILGKRLDEIVIDDPTTFRQARSTQVMTEQREKLLNTINYRFPPGFRAPFEGDGDTRMLVFMTRYGPKDLFETFRDDLGLFVVQMPALGFWDRRVTCPECGESAIADYPCEHDPPEWNREWGEAALWPERENRAMLLARRNANQITFELVDQGNVKVLSGNMFDSDWWQHGAPPKRFDLVVMGVDTAGGKDQARNDYCAIAVLGLKGDDVWILYAWRDRIPPTKQEDRIKEVAEMWSPSMIYVEEKNEGIAVYDHLVVDTRLPLRPVVPTMDKSFRAVPLANIARRRGLWLPEGEKWVRMFETEAEAFPAGEHDDMIDAVTVALNETEAGGTVGPRLRTLG